MGTDEEMDARHARREKVVRQFCNLMGWEYKTSPVFAGIRKVALGQAVALGMDKAEELLAEIERLRSIVGNR